MAWEVCLARPSSVTARTRTFANVRSTSQAQAPASPVVGTRPPRSRGTRAPSPFQPPFGRLPCLDRMSHLVRTRGGYPHRLVFLRGRSHPGCPPLAAGPAGLAAGRLRQTRAARPRRVMSPVGSERAVSSGRAGHPGWTTSLPKKKSPCTEPQSLIIQIGAAVSHQSVSV